LLKSTNLSRSLSAIYCCSNHLHTTGCAFSMWSRASSRQYLIKVCGPFHAITFSSLVCVRIIVKLRKKLIAKSVLFILSNGMRLSVNYPKHVCCKYMYHGKQVNICKNTIYLYVKSSSTKACDLLYKLQKRSQNGKNWLKN
jgi:hypothetical protein